jgi:acetate CoA/acetoacetate CoA-transferase beta subunit
MDILAGVRTIIVAMSHTTNEGAPKLVRRCALPLTSLRPVDWVVTELATFRREDRRLVLVEVAPGVTVEGVLACTEASHLVRLDPDFPGVAA